MHNLFWQALNIIFPITCAVCGRCLPWDDKRRVCDACFKEIKFVESYCLKCGKPLFYGGAHCHACLKPRVRYSFEFLRSACLYKGVVRRTIHLFKYSGKEYLGDMLGGLLAEYIRNKPDFPIGEVDEVMPVPLHWTRKLFRGYNQSELLSRRVAGAFGKELVLKAGYRKKITKPQFRLSREKRLENMKGAFGINGNSSVKNKIILVIDDICTTGSTLEEFCAVLKKAGAKRIYGLTVARG